MTEKRFSKGRILGWVGLVLGLVMIISLTRSIFRLVKQGGRLQQVRDRVSQLEVEKEGLMSEREYYQSKEFVEAEARNRLNMSRPGEAVVVMPSPSEEVVSAGVIESEKPVWQEWLEYFSF